MTQLLNPIELSEVKHLETDVRYLDRETENILYGSSNPAKNLATRQPSPDEKLSKGYRDGIKGVMLSSLSSDSYYLKGWDLGYADAQATEAKIKQAGLVILYGLDCVADAISNFNFYRSRVQAGEKLVIWYDTNADRYLLCASPSFFDRELPF